MKPLIGTCLILRLPHITDLPYLLEWENDEELLQVSGSKIETKEVEMAHFINQANKNPFVEGQQRFVIELQDQGRPIGTIDLFDIDRQNSKAGVGIVIASPQDRQQGYGQESLKVLASYAHEELKLNQLHCLVQPENTASLKFFKKAGFTQTGLLKEWFSVEGGFEDVIMMQYILPKP